jgi:hypothetical protein
MEMPLPATNSNYDGGIRAVYLLQSNERRSTVFPTRLSGVDAPDVNPIDKGPATGSQPSLRISALPTAGLCRIESADSRQSGSAIWNVGTLPAQILAKLHVLLLL